MMFVPPLPIDAALPDLAAVLRVRDAAVLVAPPGAGKTTRVPLVLAAGDWARDRKIIVLEPRRLAARMVPGDPSLKGVAAVPFDEFHERSLDADLGLALARDVQQGLRADLKLLVMSATIDGARAVAIGLGWSRARSM
jgi:ATP-dependent RNA helicase HrpB